MPAAPQQSTREQARLTGQAIRAMRLRARMTQQDAADAMGVTRTAWQNYENGRAVVLRVDVQARLAKALGGDREELLMHLATLTPRTHTGRMSGGLAEDGGAELASDTKRAVFPLAAGDVVLTYPTDMTPDDFRELGEYLQLFIRNRGPKPS